jgi:broad specificity phosphatase PhoE
MFVVLSRHAEPEPSGTDPGLSPQGRDRARVLAAMLGETGIDAIFTSELIRTKQTAAPIAERLHLTPVELSADLAVAAGQVRSAGQRVLVIGHSNTVPDLIGSLNGPGVTIKPAEFSRLFVLDLQGAASHLLSMRYGAI